MKRRAFFGLMGAAAASGPTLAKSLAREATSDAPAPFLGGGHLSSGAVAAATDNSWMSARITELRKLLKGESEEERQQRKIAALYSMEGIERFRLDTLRSVSAQHRMRMFVDGQSRRNDQLARIYYENELARLLKQLG